MAETKQAPVKQEEKSEQSPAKETNTQADSLPKKEAPISAGQETKYNTLAIVGFIASFFVSIAGLICSIIALNQLKKTPEKGKGLAIAGIVISIIGLLIIPIFLTGLGGLAYFGALSPGTMLPASCTMSQGFACSDTKMSPDGVLTLKIRNVLGNNIETATITIGDSCSFEVSNWRNSRYQDVECRLETGPQTRTSIGIEYMAEGETIMRKSSGESYLPR